MAGDALMITGGNGQLGTKLIERSLQMGSVRPVSASQQPCSNGFLGDFEFQQLDVTAAVSVGELFRTVRPRWVIHTAAMTDVDGCEREPEAAWRANVVGAEARDAMGLIIDGKTYQPDQRLRSNQARQRTGRPGAVPRGGDCPHHGAVRVHADGAAEFCHLAGGTAAGGRAGPSSGRPDWFADPC